jgi:hypothetical protein
MMLYNTFLDDPTLDDGSDDRIWMIVGFYSIFG